MTPVRIPFFVEDEILEAITYYDRQRDGLGSVFAVEIKRLLARISIFPESAPRITSDHRLCLLRKFPYALLYQIESEVVVILALMHQMQGPGILGQRLKRIT